MSASYLDSRATQESSTRDGRVVSQRCRSDRGGSGDFNRCTLRPASIGLVKRVGARKSAPTLRPIEFLYLDGARVLTYLEEIQGGEVKSEEESHKLTKSLSAKLAVQGELETGTW